MTDPDEDTRVIAAEAPGYNATVVKRVDHTADLATFWFRLDAGPVPLAAGQYVTLGVAYVCGNPEMIQNMERVLLERGFAEAHVKKELYWPALPRPEGMRRSQPTDMTGTG